MPTRQRVWLYYLVAGVVAIAAHQLIPDKVTRDITYLVLGLVGVVGIVAGVRLNSPAQRQPWYLMAAGQLLWVIGDAVYTWYDDVLHAAPFPSAADWFYLAAYPVLALGIAALIRERGVRRDVGALVDSLTVTAGLGLLSWVVLAGPTLTQSQESLLAATVAAAYPIADVVLVAALVMLLVTPGGRAGAMRLLLWAIAGLILADSLYLALSLFGSGDTYPIDWLWLVSYLLWGAAALHPSMESVSRPSEAVDIGFRRTRLAAMTLAALIAPGTLAVQRLAATNLDVWAIIIGAVTIILLVLVRMKIGIDQVASVNTELAQLRDELAFQAAHDWLTELPNRAQARRGVEAALNRAQRTGDLVAMLFVDLDGFKAVNDTHGHRAGDLVLREVAQRLREHLRAGDIAARLGGDEFVVLLEPVESEAAAVSVANRIVTALAQPVPLGSQVELTVGASVGVSFNSDSGTDAEQLLHEADVAAYRAKALGRGRVEVFSRALGVELDNRAELEAALALALQRDELVLHYQPIVSVQTGVVEGYEALVRWDRPGVGLLPPGDFIPVAEKSDLICDVDTWVLHQAARQLQCWNSYDDSADLFVAVNVSGRHVNAVRINDDVATVLDRYDIDPHQLVLEITETVLVEDCPALANLHQLRRLGVGLSLDDFGNGHNTVRQLSRLPLSTVKIDRSYLDTPTPSAYRLLELMVYTVHSLDLRVVAEGVERRDQLELLRTLQVDSAQGFLIGPPAPPDELEQLAQLHPAEQG